MFPLADHAEGGDENQPHNSAHNSASTANQDVVAAQLAAMQQQFGVFQLGQSHIAPAQQPLLDDVTRRLNSLEKLVAEQRGAPPPHHAIDSIPHPLNTNITLEPYPAGFKIPQLETYDGTKDPNDHLHAFYSCMQAQNASNTLMCKIFPFTLRAVVSGLNHERFRDSLIKHPATTFSEVNDRSLKFIIAEEYALSQNPTPSKNQNPDWRDENPSRKWMKTAQNRGPMPTSTPRFGRPNSTPPQQSARTTASRKLQSTEQTRSGTSTSPPSTSTTSQNYTHDYRRIGSRRDELQTKEVICQRGVITPHNDLWVISVMINNCQVQHVLIDIGSAPDIMYYHYFESLGLDPTLLQRYDGPIYGFNNQPVPVEGILTMNVAFGSGRTYVTPSVRFLMVKMPSSFNVVISRPTLTEIRAMVSQSHLCMKLPTSMGIATLRGNQEDEARAAPGEDVEEVQIDDRDPNRKTQIGTQFSPEERAELITFLRANKDVFAWTSADMPRIPTSVSQHKLNTNPLKKPVAQKQHLFGWERLKVIKEKVEKLLQAGFVRRVNYCEWVANPVLVKKANGKWRMCIDYTNLNQAYPKDYEEKTSFYAGDEIYCYVMMPFDLKNAGATYQKMVTIVFRAQISRNLEVYVDDIVVKSLKAKDHLADLEETFNNLKKNIMRLNPAKCIFGVESGKFLGFMVSRKGIEVNPEKIKAVAEMEPPKSVKDVQRLTGRVAALHRFISKSVDKCLSFFKIMRLAAQKDESGKQKNSPPLLTKVDDGEILYLYLGILDEAISSMLRLAIRAQALADFIVECTSAHFDSHPMLDSWILYVDGASSNKDSGAGAILLGRDGDSQLVVNQVNSVCEVVDPVMTKYATMVAELKSKFQKFHLSKTPRAENEQVDSLSKFASDGNQSSKSIFIEVLDEPSFLKPKMMEISTDPSTPSWTDPIISFLRDGTVPANKQEEMRLRKKASRYTFVNDVLHKRSFSLSLLRCLNPYEAKYALWEVHEGVCGSHIGARTLAHKVLRQGSYWPNMYKDATQFVQRCQKCQFFAHLIHQPVEELTNLVAPWPFAQWGLDLLGPFMKGVGGVTHLIVGVDYFTKWVEVQPLSSLTSKKVKDFVFSSIICRYGIPNQIVADNGTQFNCSSFRDLCSNYGIRLQFTSVYHPEFNGMVKFVNKVILEGIKPRLELHKARWADELNNVLWAYKTMSRRYYFKPGLLGETPYHLAFGIEAVILIEIGVPSFRVTHFDEGRNGQLLRENLDLLDEVREEAQLRTLVYKQKIANFYNKRVRPQTFKVGDLVLRKVGITGSKLDSES
ncbi:hypothetical protein SLEP1_g56466 [Rubroshorea leprosula]|uniref:Integrase catalytic domain-containing protein n=1 Tax=Rubroshorea leprosula TaxID=152421 RepID=A0AAV5MIU8_9ROSI|nr:hypothetical protein SLEP1_g56466 [Rubroshorea leprosula]